MKIVPLASDSMGVRSLSVLVETDRGFSVVIDGGARLGPKRYGLPPTSLELTTLDHHVHEIEERIREADVVVISHYHYDHYLPDSVLYSGKILLVKDPENHINASQRTRGTLFCDLWREDADVRIADGQEFNFDDITIRFSGPVPHGEDDSRLGTVLMTKVLDSSSGETLLHTSDVQGPVSTRTTEIICDDDPDLLILDGAPTYLNEWRDPLIIEKVERNLLNVLDSVEGNIIMDHHHLRDIDWRSYCPKSFESGRIRNFAEFNGLEPSMLESRRKDIWRSEHGKG